jgi:hypothetical protein
MAPSTSKAARIDVAMNQVTPSRILETSKESKPKKLSPGRPKALTNREYYIGVALGGLLARTSGEIKDHQMEDIKKEANRWGDFMTQG